MKRCAAFSLLMVMIGCGGSNDSAGEASGAFTTFSDDMPDDLPAGECRDTEGCETDGTDNGGAFGTTGAVVESECELTEECDGAGACVATWDEGSRGPFECRFACIPTLDETSWCSDDASCCAEGDVCTPRGYCVPPEDDGSGATGGSSGGDSTSG